jgi:hypothetical protein
MSQLPIVNHFTSDEDIDAPSVAATMLNLTLSSDSAAMSALGQKQTLRDVWRMSALPPKADMGEKTMLRD